MFFLGIGTFMLFQHLKQGQAWRSAAGMRSGAAGNGRTGKSQSERQANMDRMCGELPPGEHERCKREIFERMNARQRKFVERVGYENWDPFQPPNEPMDMRTDKTRHTVRQLLQSFEASPFNSRPGSREYQQGALECAMGMVREDERFLGIFDFCLWYADFLDSKGKVPIAW